MVASAFYSRFSLYHSISSLNLTILTSGSQPNAIEQAAGAQAVNRSSVASLAFLIWDICITFDEEVKFIWPRGISYSNLLFFFIRYFPACVQISLLLVGTELTPAFHFTSHDCFIWQVYQGVAALLIVLAVDYILLVRVFALYHRRSIVMTTLSLLYVLEITTMSVSLALTLPGVQYNSICVVIGMPNAILIYGIASIAFQGTLFAFTAAKFVMAVRGGWGNIPIIGLVMRDGTWAFCLLFAIMLAEASLYFLPNSAFEGILYGWLLTAFSFVGYRILLNIQHLSPIATESYWSESTRSRAMHMIEFTTRIFAGGQSTAALEEGNERGHEMVSMSLSRTDSQENNRRGDAIGL